MSGSSFNQLIQDFIGSEKKTTNLTVVVVILRFIFLCSYELEIKENISLDSYYAVIFMKISLNNGRKRKIKPLS